MNGLVKGVKHIGKSKMKLTGKKKIYLLCYNIILSKVILILTILEKWKILSKIAKIL